MKAREKGSLAEDVVAKFLMKRGYKIIARNVTYPFGEIDLVASEGKILVFVEVKYRKSESRFGEPFEAVTYAKQKKITRAALAFLQKYQVEPACRFDVICLCGDLAAPKIDHICDAFSIGEF